jgi:hypothetical protein
LKKIEELKKFVEGQEPEDGQVWEHKDGDRYLVVQVNHQKYLINIEPVHYGRLGNRWNDRSTFGETQFNFKYIGMFDSLYQRIEQ